mmetsp:Transcript_37166/g.59710  ORF Transcript_37166/g.59710 Transcript_37166/m.59710 type:complete len:214 (-) Transcript_37166:314-955(-)
MCNASSAWTTSQARKAMIALEKHSVDWVEIPIVTDDVDGYNSLSDLAVPIAAGETVTTEQQMMHLIREGKLNYAQLGVNDIGGITPFMKAAHYAEIHRVPVTSHGVHDLHVHLMAALSNSSYTEVCEYRIDEFITQPLKIANGKAQISTLPGHGIVFQFKSLEKYRDAGNPKSSVVLKRQQARISSKEATSITKRTPKESWDAKSSARDLMDY